MFRWRTAYCCRRCSLRFLSSIFTALLGWSFTSLCSTSSGISWWSELQSLPKAKMKTGKRKLHWLHWFIPWLFFTVYLIQSNKDTTSWRNFWKRAFRWSRCRLFSRWSCRLWNTCQRWEMIQLTGVNDVNDHAAFMSFPLWCFCQGSREEAEAGDGW